MNFSCGRLQRLSRWWSPPSSRATAERAKTVSIQLFNNPQGQRGSAIVIIPMHELYDLIRARLEYVKGDFDPDAVCQNICCEVEKNQGTFPNNPPVE